MTVNLYPIKWRKTCSDTVKRCVLEL